MRLQADTDGLKQLRTRLDEACRNGESRLDLTDPHGGRIEFIRGVGGLQVLPLTEGVVIFGDSRGLIDVCRGVDYCLQNAASSTPLDGYHHHIHLHNEIDPSYEDPIGEITIYWRAAADIAWC